MHIETQMRIFNVYGVTEVSCWSFIYELTCEDFTYGMYLPIRVVYDLSVFE